jgi:uncharacterized membrane protein YeaQ/YmgE (transglycosylase-associated protein family)
LLPHQNFHKRSEEDMTLLGLIILLVIAAVAGALGQSLAGYNLGGCFMSMIVGFIGAFLGMWISRQLGLPEPLPVTVGGETFPVFWSIVGSAIFAGVLGLLFRSRRRLI